MIKEAYCSYEVAKLLKEKGFDIPCYGRYSVRSQEFHLDTTKPCNNGGISQYSAPTHQMAMAWLREVHNISIELIAMRRNCWGYYVCKILDNTVKDLNDRNYFNTYEEAVEAALKYSLENSI